MTKTENNRRPFQFRLDLRSGVPVYRQIIDQVMAALATGRLAGGDQLPTVRQLAVDLAINPNTVVRAYRELEIRDVLETQQGTGTFISQQSMGGDGAERERRLERLVGDFVARAGEGGFDVGELIDRLERMRTGPGKKR